MEVDLCRERLFKFTIAINDPKCRLSKFTSGNGLDLGFGGSPISPSAICVDREEGHIERSNHPCPSPTHLVGDAADLYWFRDGVLDYVFSSHCIEDFEDTAVVLKEWLRVIKPGGHLVLYAPDQKVYEEHCRKDGSLPNGAHKHPDFGLEFVKKCLFSIGVKQEQIVWENPHTEEYSFDCVVRK